jgi:regulator of cell morphogenesis and NO signaling
MKKEEIILFPAIRQGRTSGIHRPIALMRDDHDEHGADIARMRELTHNLTPPPNACGSWQTLYEEIENNVLFPKFEE